MSASILRLDGSRELTISSIEATADRSIQAPFVTLLPAYAASERQKAAGLTKKLIEIGCIEFCCVGPEAELLHDALDEIIEAEGALEVVTTWTEDPTEGCDYFLHAAGAARVNLLALIQSQPQLQVILEKETRRTGFVEPSS